MINIIGASEMVYIHCQSVTIHFGKVFKTFPPIRGISKQRFFGGAFLATLLPIKIGRSASFDATIQMPTWMAWNSQAIQLGQLWDITCNKVKKLCPWHDGMWQVKSFHDRIRCSLHLPGEPAIVSDCPKNLSCWWQDISSHHPQISISCQDYNVILLMIPW